jgi:hypothetical protein
MFNNVLRLSVGDCHSAITGLGKCGLLASYVLGSAWAKALDLNNQVLIGEQEAGNVPVNHLFESVLNILAVA